MLGKRKEKKMEQEKSKVETILGNGTLVEGDINTKGSLRVEGKVKGNIKAEGDLCVGESGILDAVIEARNVVIAGTVNGNITALEKIEILPSGKLKGDIITKTIKIEEGASFIGSSKPRGEKNYIKDNIVKKEVAANKEKN